jgi:hypothetical protein
VPHEARTLLEVSDVVSKCLNNVSTSNATTNDVADLIEC